MTALVIIVSNINTCRTAVTDEESDKEVDDDKDKASVSINSLNRRVTNL